MLAPTHMPDQVPTHVNDPVLARPECSASKCIAESNAMVESSYSNLFCPIPFGSGDVCIVGTVDTVGR